MKDTLAKLFWPILKFFETDEVPTNYKPSHRVILIVVGALFMVLTAGSVAAAYFSGQVGALIPVLVFFSVGTVTLVVGLLGSDSAVAKIWGRNK